MLIRCLICGKEFEKRRHGPSKYCSQECRRTFELQEHHRKRAERGMPKLGDAVACTRCGVMTPRRSRRGQNYCEPCGMFKQAERTVRFRERHRELLNERSRERDKQPRRNLDKRMKWMIWWGLKEEKAGRSWRSHVGYSLDELVAHIERQFTKRMTWENMGRWHIDHIIPRVAFTYTSSDDPDFRACWALTNLRPLWGRDNIRKSAKRTHLI